MIRIILIILFALLFLVLLIPLLFLLLVMRILSWFGIVRRPSTNVFYKTWHAGMGFPNTDNNEPAPTEEKKERTFNKTDGEYVEFEEIKE